MTCATHACFHCAKLMIRTHYCGGCKAATYCDSQCARADWPNHRAACGPSTAVDMDTFGIDKPLASRIAELYPSFRTDGSHYSFGSLAPFPSAAYTKTWWDLEDSVHNTESEAHWDASTSDAYGLLVLAAYHYEINTSTAWMTDSESVLMMTSCRAACEHLLEHHDVVRAILVAHFRTRAGAFEHDIVEGLEAISALPAGAAALAACEDALRGLGRTFRTCRLERHWITREHLIGTLTNMAFHGVLTERLLLSSGLANALADELHSLPKRALTKNELTSTIELMESIVLTTRLFEPFVLPLRALARGWRWTDTRADTPNLVPVVLMSVFARFARSGPVPKRTAVFLPLLDDVLTKATLGVHELNMIQPFLATTPFFAAHAVRRGIVPRLGTLAARRRGSKELKDAAQNTLRAIALHAVGRAAQVGQQ